MLLRGMFNCRPIHLLLCMLLMLVLMVMLLHSSVPSIPFADLCASLYKPTKLPEEGVTKGLLRYYGKGTAEIVEVDGARYKKMSDLHEDADKNIVMVKDGVKVVLDKSAEKSTKPVKTESKVKSPKEVHPREIIDLDAYYPNGPPNITWPEDVKIKLPEFNPSQPVPNILHFAWYGGSSGRGNFLKLHHYISFLSGYRRLHPKRILFWYDELPTGEWWEKIRKQTHKVLQLVKRRPPPTIFGNPIKVPEHHSDIVRLEGIMYYGGVYIDLDVIVLKDFKPLSGYNTTMGYEVSYGLCNGIIMSKAAAPFLLIWYDKYRNFNDTVWSEHSVMLPARLAKKYPKLIHTENDTMHKPYWGELSKIYGIGVKYDWSNNYSIHLWYRLHGKEYTLNEINKMDSTLGQIFRFTMYDSPAIIK